jgi:L-lactate dehydrogenase complex protein LldF
MKSSAHLFKPQARRALADRELQAALGRAKSGFIDKRAASIAKLPEFEALRERGRRIRAHALDHLDSYLERFEERLLARGGRLHWAVDAAQARELITGICKAADARLAIKSKTMVGEEIALNDALIGAGIATVETDLGEYIIQLAEEPPSHIIAPAVHKTRRQIAELFSTHHGRYPLDAVRAVPELVDEAREVLREKFLQADVGITGANFLIAEEGAAIVVTNEGNADLSMTLPRVHIVLAAIDKLVPTLEDASVLLRLLARSATGQEITTYTTLVAGARQPHEPEGPVEYHVVLLDNGRSDMLAGEFREMLQCIRCGACLNHCPVYSAIGGHAYGWVYPGPMGSILTPHFIGLDKSYDLPNACTLNGRCADVCPVKIPLPTLLRRMRMRQFELRLPPFWQRRLLAVWAWFAGRPRLYRHLNRVARAGLALLQRIGIRRPPLAGAWSSSRELPRPERITFVDTWQREKRHGGK